MSDFRWHVYQEDCLAVLKRAPADYFDAMVTDPPAGISFMGRDWDNFAKSREGVSGMVACLSEKQRRDRDNFISFMTCVMKEAYRTLKPGAHCLVWALPRTSHWTATALEDAGFEVRDCLTHHFGSGFPKSADVSKALDKLAGAEREVIGKHPNPASQNRVLTMGRPEHSGSGWQGEPMLTVPATDEAKAWSGYGTALKPATEHWILCRKPLAESSIARNVLTHGTGAINIDACRVNRASDDVPGWHKTGANGSFGYQSEKCPDCVGGEPCPRCGGTGWLKGTFAIREMTAEEIQERCGNKGRWPPNLLLTHAADCDEDCCEDCPVAELDRQSGTTKSGKMRAGTPRQNRTGYAGDMPEVTGCETHGDSGGASRFFPTFRYQAKPSRSEKEAGLDSLPATTLNRVNPGGIEHDPRWAPVQVKNSHPCVKSVSLMRWLCRLITPPGGLVLDPFCGSGSTGVACMKEGFRFIGIEQDAHYCEIAGARIAAAESKEEETDGRRTE